MAIDFPLQKTDETQKTELEELRELLVGSEINELDKLKKRMDDPTQRAMEISQVLPEAISQRGKTDRELINALEPVIEEGVSNYINNNPQSLKNVLVPMIATSVNEATTHYIRNLLLNFNRWRLRNVSLRGIKWRLQAVKSRKTFDEIVQLNTLLYKVEQVFIIHKKTNEVLQHVSELKDDNIEEANMFSETLKAIQSSSQFGKKSVSNEIQVGDYSVWIEHGKKLSLAGVIRGTPSPELRKVFKNSLDQIESDHKENLKNYDGNKMPFQSSKSVLTNCLQVEYGKEEDSFLHLWFIGLALLCLVSFFAFTTIRDNMRWQDYISSLQNEKGVIVLNEHKKGGKFFVSGMRDPLAISPKYLLKLAKINPEKVVSKWEPFNALHPEIIIKRAKSVLKAPKTVTLAVDNSTLIISGLAPPAWIQEVKNFSGKITGVSNIKEVDLFDINSSELFIARLGVQLEPPQTVSMTVKNGVLHISGSAPHNWIKKVRKAAPKIAGIVKIDETNLVDTDKSELADLKERMEKHIILFRTGTAKPVPGQEKSFQKLHNDILVLNEIVKGIKKGHVEIVGHTDKTGSERANLKLSQQRAEVVLTILRSRRLDTSNLTAIGVGAKEPLRSESTVLDREFNRSVTFRVLFY